MSFSSSSIVARQNIDLPSNQEDERCVRRGLPACRTCYMGSEQECVSCPDLMGIFDLSDIVYTRWNEGERLDACTGLAWL